MIRNIEVSILIYRKILFFFGNVFGNLNVKGILNEIKIFLKGYVIVKYRCCLYVFYCNVNNLLLDIFFDIIF